MLPFHAGDSIIVLERTNDEWWLGQKGEEEGWIPAKYVDIRAR